MVRGEGSKKSSDIQCKKGVFGKYQRVQNVERHTTSEEVKVILGEGTISRRQGSRVFYSKNCNPSDIESLLVRPLEHSISVCKARGRQGGARSYAEVVKGNEFGPRNDSRFDKSRVFWAQKYNKTNIHSQVKPSEDNAHLIVIRNDNKTVLTKGGVKCNETKTANRADNGPIQTMGHTSQVMAGEKKGGESPKSTPPSDVLQGAINENPICQQRLLFDISNVDNDKFMNSIIYNDPNNVSRPTQCLAYDLWSAQSKVKFGFIPLTDPIMPSRADTSQIKCRDPIELHNEVKKYDLPNYLGARIPVESQLNIHAWESLLEGYWDKQLLECLKFGFPLGFNRTCPLSHDKNNHKSAVLFPEHVEKYIEDEQKFGAIIGPFQKSPIENLHYSPFMTRHKPNSDNRRVILDLSWPRGASVNAGVEKNGYMGSEFKLTFPTIDDLTQELVKIGRGAHIFKVDVSRAFRHLNVDPRDYDVLGVNWGVTFIDTRIPFGSRHGSQFFQRTSDAVRHVMRLRDVNVINYIDDFLGYGTPSVAKNSFDALIDVMTQLGLTISESKLVEPTTKAVCLGILVDTVQGTVAIPPEKLEVVKQMVNDWRGRKWCTKRQLQSLLGTLLYVHKCVKPARYFLNRMLTTLRSVSNPARVDLDQDFQRDLRWFHSFLPQYNGVSMYSHTKSKSILELDACLTGLGGRWGNMVYHLPIERDFANLDIVHLEMVNIVMALRLFARLWAGTRILVKCDNEAVVKVLKAGKARDPFSATCARNVWYLSALADIDLQYEHILGRNNTVADLLSRWQLIPNNMVQLHQFIPNPVWLPVSINMLEVDYNI